MIDRTPLSDRDAFAAVFRADALGFQAEDGEVRIDDPALGRAPNLAIRRERQDPPGAVTVVATIDTTQAMWLAFSVITTEYAADGRPMEPRALILPVMKSSTGEYFVETHVGRLVAAGEYTEYFWTVAGARLGLDG